MIVSYGINAADLAWPVDKPWRGTAAHLGPHRHTPVRASLEFKTSCALLALMAASTTWARARIGDVADTRVLAELSEAMVCYQASPLYLGVPEQRHRLFPQTKGMDLAQGCMAVYPWLFFNTNIHIPGRWPTYPPVIQTAQFIYLTRYIMPKRATLYNKWMKAVIARLSDIAHLADPRQEPVPSGSPPEVYLAEAARVIGRPLSPWALNVDEVFDEERNDRDYASALGAVDWQSNRFLRSPEEMQAAGFGGEPYAIALSPSGDRT